MPIKSIVVFMLASVALLALDLSTLAVAQSPAPMTDTQVQEMTTSNKTIVENAVNGWMAGDGKALQALLSDDIEWTISGNSAAAGTTYGRAQLMEKVLGPFGARFRAASDPFRPRKIHGVYADGDTVIVHFEGAGITNAGTRYDNDYVWLLTLKNGKAIKGTAFFDSIVFNELWRVEPDYAE